MAYTRPATGVQFSLEGRQEAVTLAPAPDASDLDQQVTDWQQLHAMSSLLLQARSVADQFAVTLKSIAALHGCERGVVSLYDHQQGGLVTQAALGMSDSAIVELGCVPSGAGACGLAFQQGRRVIVEDTETDPVYDAYRGYAREHGIAAVYSTPFFSLGGEPLGVLSLYFATPRRPTERELRLTDICTSQIGLFVDRDRSEQAMRREQQRSHRILESMMDGFMLLGSDFRIVQINAEGLRIDGRPASDIVGRSHWDLWPGSENLPIGQFYKKAMAERQPCSIEHCFDMSGEWRWFSVIAYPHEDDGIVVLYRDITEQKQTHDSLARVRSESERRYRLYETILDNTPDLAYVFDLDHRFIYANQALLAMWGKSWDESIGRNCLENGYEPWHAEMHGREIEQVKATKRPIRGEVPFDGTNGRRIYDYIFVPVLGPDGEVEAVAGTTRDVTERKQTEETLREANLRKDEFLAMLAHELRNPLAPISAAAELIAMGQLGPGQLQYASQTIGRQVRHLTGLVDDLLDASRVTRGLVKIEKRPQDFKSVISSAVEQTRPLVEAQRHRLVLDLGTEPAHVLGDMKRLVQILANLLNNAAKYTPAGGNISLRMDVTDEQVLLAIQDDGSGIERELQGRMFELFTQAERTADRSQGGLGIGLAVVKSLVELHGGTIRCKSEGIGKGCEFMVTLPRLKLHDMPATAAAAAGGPSPAGSKRRILVVDDNADGAAMLAMCLEAMGHEVMIELGSRQALERARLERPDVCLLDIGLPELDGFGLARTLRSGAETAQALLVAVTGYGREQDRKNGMAAGFDGYLTKPVDMQQLAGLIARSERIPT